MPDAHPAAVKCAYRILAGDREIPLSHGRHILGRAQDAAVVVDDGGISRHHACITIDATGATLQDLGSKNGTTLNGVPLAGPTRLNDGALIVIGTTALRFRALEALTSTATVMRQR